VSDAALRSKLAKLLALARQGIDGERVNAQEVLDRLLTEHGLRVSDIEGDEEREFSFRYTDKWDRKLAIQTVCRVLQRRTGLYSYGRSKAFYATMTVAQSLEVDLTLNVYRKAFEKERERLWLAFIQKHRLFPPSPGEDEDPNEPELTREEAAALVSMMRVMSDVTVPRAALTD